ncbi:hypothetical protein IT570_04100 [Candidatus Sumerlaeota bacterium]|nr:hypothetical protein [Candidatus Sumerlaeota bacterium]
MKIHARLLLRTALLALGILMTMSAVANPVRVALLSDAACTDERSREAAWKVISADPGIAARKVTAKEMIASLDAFDVLLFPGGTGSGEAKALGVEGGRAVTEAVKNGKGVIGVCAGGWLVAEGWNPETSAIDLVNAELYDSDHWARGEQMIAVSVNGDDGDTSRTMWFENGPIFAPAKLDGLPNYTPLVKYVSDLAAKDAPKGMMTGRDAVIAAPLGKGRVVAFGPHPELSPNLNHWLTNAIKWVAKGEHAPPPSVKTVLEGKEK